MTRSGKQCSNHNITIISSLVEPDDMLSILCLYLDGSKPPLTVDVGASKSVGGLRKAIRTADPESDPESLILWKVGLFQSIVILLPCVVIATETVSPA